MDFSHVSSVLRISSEIRRRESWSHSFHSFYPSFFTMNKKLIVGLAAVAATGTVLIGSSFAASGNMNGSWKSYSVRSVTSVQNSLSGKVSSEALTALTNLMNSHRSEMDALMARSGSLSQTEKMAKQQEFKKQMDELLIQYPELKTALPQMGRWMGMGMGWHGGRGGHEEDQMKALIAELPSEAQTALQTLRDDYKSKMDALRAEEQAKRDAILAQYPAIKSQIDSLNTSKQSWHMRSHRGSETGMMQ